MKKLIILIVALTCVFSACKEEEEDSLLNSFVSLTAENDTIITGHSTKITAVVDGENVSFQWSSTAGDILGSGNVVDYVAPTCTPGSNQISCTANASNKTETKTITITVL
ncbi:MAG TPA: hypothetical protein PKL96_05120 [Bacteroidales bacterium]|nr:hypothetical protein [Bacteroidales bacterium]HPS26753.1 hypothetical protein [Bacteroidales bacterium]